MTGPSSTRRAPTRATATRTRLGRAAGLLLTLVLLIGALAWSLGGEDDHPVQAGPDLTPLRTAAALQPCPAGLSPELPDLTLSCLGGGPAVRVRGTSGLPTVVNVWGTWCGPCLREVPAFSAFAGQAQGRVAVVGVLTEDSTESALTYAPTVGMRYASVVDDDRRISDAFGKGVPKTLFVDGTGRITFVQRGEITSHDQLVSLVAEHLGVQL